LDLDWPSAWCFPKSHPPSNAINVATIATDGSWYANQYANHALKRK